jgi:CDP-paratose 2-epimerase
MSNAASAPPSRRPRLARPALARGVAPILVTGGSGFIGCNLADSWLRDGRDVIVLDNLSRPGVEQNLDWLVENHGKRVHPVRADVRDAEAIAPVIAEAGAVFHLAAQTAVTTSLASPLDDFAVNAGGTLNVLEAVRRSGRRIPVVFASTNKVYGGLGDIEMVAEADGYVPADDCLRTFGIDESRPLDFCTPYGCSKGVADQYVLDYARSFGLPTAVLRMSCIYGPHQFGTEDQGWVAHFLVQALEGREITIYGDGKQVRDILHVRDAVAAYRALLTAIERISGHAFNLGGGPHNAVSLEMVLGKIERVTGEPVARAHGEWREGDQLYFVADTRALERAVGWKRHMSWRQGIGDLYDWLVASRLGATGAPRQRASA